MLTALAPALKTCHNKRTGKGTTPTISKVNTMSTPLVSAPKNSIYRSYWKSASQGASETRVRVLVARDVDLVEGFEPTVDATFDSVTQAEAYIAKWQPLYDEEYFFIG